MGVSDRRGGSSSSEGSSAPQHTPASSAPPTESARSVNDGLTAAEMYKQYAQGAAAGGRGVGRVSDRRGGSSSSEGSSAPQHTPASSAPPTESARSVNDGLTA